MRAWISLASRQPVGPVRAPLASLFYSPRNWSLIPRLLARHCGVVNGVSGIDGGDYPMAQPPRRVLIDKTREAARAPVAAGRAGVLAGVDLAAPAACDGTPGAP